MRTVTLCKKCVMPTSRPRIVFKDGICNACAWAEQKKSIDWEERAKEFDRLCMDMKEKGRKRGNAYDCVVPFSGGKDSATILYKLKHEHGLNPLGVTYGQLMWTDCGWHNWDQCSYNDLEILYWRVNESVSKKLCKRFFIERGYPKLHYNAGVNAVPILTALKFNIPYVMYAEHGESEYGGLVLDEESLRTRNLTEVLEHQIGDHPLNWAIDDVSERDLYPYIYPETFNKVTAFYFSYFFPWDIYENAKFARENLDFTTAHSWRPSVMPMDNWRGRSDGSFEGFDSIDDKIDDLDFYMMYIKFGFGRATRMASRLIQNGHITREQGLELVKRCDGEFPSCYMSSILEYLDMDPVELESVIDKHRNEEIWQKDGSAWRLRHRLE
jgi:N-acetyl sugar amidotransferase